MTHWRDDAACIGHGDIFYPGERDFAAVREAKAMCRECPVIRQCLQHALDAGEVHGIWGGASPKERRLMMSQRWHA